MSCLPLYGVFAQADHVQGASDGGGGIAADKLERFWTHPSNIKCQRLHNDVSLYKQPTPVSIWLGGEYNTRQQRLLICLVFHIHSHSS